MKFIALLVALSAPAWAQVAAEANGGYKTPEARANVAKSLANPDRDKQQRPKELIEALKLKPGMTVADLGTGVGYMLPWLAKAVGPDGHVVAEDIFPDFLEQAKQTAAKEKLASVTFVLGTDKDTRLPEKCCDLALTLDAYHHFDYPGAMLASIARGLKPGGRLVIVDYYKRPEAMAGGRALQHIRLDMDDVIKEVEGFGWVCLSKAEFNPKTQYIATFEKR
ncbi:MAG: methyltransferase domain-containing protein [Bryobacteraceae bacterium]